jgi:hypothetical protein
MKKSFGFIVFLAFTTQFSQAGLDDAYIYSAKFGLSTESVTTNWTTLENSLSWGGQLNGPPKDSEHSLFYYNNRLSMAVLNYELDPLTFETEAAYKRWMITAINLLMEKAKRKYGEPSEDSLNCPVEPPFNICEGSVVWNGELKVFEITVRRQILDIASQNYYGMEAKVGASFIYASSSDYALLRERFPTLIRNLNEARERRSRALLREYLKGYLLQRNMSFEELLNETSAMVSEINRIKRASSLQYLGGVKANYAPEKWVRSFRLQ